MTIIYSENLVIRRRVASAPPADLKPEVELLSKLLPNHHQIHETETIPGRSEPAPVNIVSSEERKSINLSTAAKFVKIKSLLKKK